MSLGRNHVVVSSQYEPAMARYIQRADINHSIAFAIDEELLRHFGGRERTFREVEARMEQAKFNAKAKIEEAMREWEREIGDFLGSRTW